MAKILLVEDEINIASFIERGLKEFGHTVTVCHDGKIGTAEELPLLHDLLLHVLELVRRSQALFR